MDITSILSLLQGNLPIVIAVVAFMFLRNTNVANPVVNMILEVLRSLLKVPAPSPEPPLPNPVPNPMPQPGDLLRQILEIVLKLRGAGLHSESDVLLKTLPELSSHEDK